MICSPELTLHNAAAFSGKISLQNLSASLQTHFSQKQNSIITTSSPFEFKASYDLVNKG